MLLVHLLSNRPIFYGWIIVGIASLVAFSSGPGQSYTFSVFIDSMIADSGLSRTDISVLYAVGTGISAATVMIVSRMADKFGPRMMVVITVTCLTLTCIGMGFATWWLAFFVAFMALRAFGQGSIPINATLLTAQWFVRIRGRAMAVMLLGFSFSMALMPILSRTLIDGLGWRMAYVFLGVFIWLLVVPVAMIFLRNTPEEMGLYPDGSVDSPEEDTVLNIVGDDRRKILTSTTFWGLALPLSTPSFVSTALVFHQAAIFSELGMSATVAAAAFLPLSISAVVASVSSGFIADRFGPKRLFYVAMILLVTSIVVIGFVDSLPLALLYSVILGTSNGTGQLVSNVLWAHYYGRHRLGRVQGSANMIMIAASALGPLPLAMAQGFMGEFGTGIMLMGVLPICAVVVMSLVNTDHIK